MLTGSDRLFSEEQLNLLATVHPKLFFGMQELLEERTKRRRIEIKASDLELELYSTKKDKDLLAQHVIQPPVLGFYRTILVVCRTPPGTFSASQKFERPWTSISNFGLGFLSSLLPLVAPGLGHFNFVCS